MSVNRGKAFEECVRKSFIQLSDVSIDRLHDQTTGYKGSQNICDFIVYRKPYELYIECKAVHGNTLSIHGNDPNHKYGNITKRQWEGMFDKAQIDGVIAGVLCWWVDRETTKFIPIQTLELMRTQGYKSVRYNLLSLPVIEVFGRKKRVFYEYDMNRFLDDVERRKKEWEQLDTMI